jgi:hypothetical protein
MVDLQTFKVGLKLVKLIYSPKVMHAAELGKISDCD